MLCGRGRSGVVEVLAQHLGRSSDVHEVRAAISSPIHIRVALCSSSAVCDPDSGSVQGSELDAQ